MTHIINFDGWYDTTDIPKEILALVEHHWKILKCRFPDYGYRLYEWPVHYWLRFEISDGDTSLLVASFTSSSISIATAASGPDFADMDYADPRFTDNVLTNILEELVG